MSDNHNNSKRPPTRRLSITARIMTTTFGAVMVAFAVVAFVQIRGEYTANSQSMIQRANLLADLHAIALAEPMRKSQLEIMTNTLTGMLAQDDVVGARALDTNGFPLASSGDGFDGGPDVVIVRRQVILRGQGALGHVGYVDVAMSTERLDDARLSNIVTSVAIIAFMVFLLLTALYLSVRHITAPLDRLNAVMHRLAEGGRNLDIPYLDRADQIGRAAWAVKRFHDNAQELTKLRENLEQRVEEQTLFLRRAMEEAENASKAKSDFLSSMSHELRTPLNAIMGFAQLLELDKKKHKGDERYSEAVDQILNSANQLLALIEQLLDLSRIESGVLHVELSETKILPVLHDVLDSQKALAEKYKVRLSLVDFDCGVETVHTDAGLLAQVLQHLLSNAIKYNRPGGRADMACHASENGRIRISVTDTGRGIPPAKRHQLFVPFQRLGAESSVIEGTGIGLSIAKKMVDAMHGEIGYQSVHGSGSTFWVDIPIEKPDAAAAPKATVQPAKDAKTPVPPPASVETAPARGRSVLYVEDSPSNVALLKQYFAVMENAPELLIAETGEAGVEMAREQSPDLILMDINLPGISGVEAMLAIRKIDTAKHAPVIAVSADSTQEEINKALAAGFNDYMTKPIKLKALKDMIDKALSATA